MVKRTLLLTALIFVISLSQAQQITLEELIQKAEQNYPANEEKSYVRSLGEENEKILGTDLYPQLTASGEATYQSEVTEFSLPGETEIPIQKKDNYNVGLDLRFSLTEFGIVGSKRQLEKVKTKVGIEQLDVELQGIRESITTAFGNVLLQQENKKILLNRKADLEAQRKKVAVGVTNGAVLKSNQLVFESEILSAEQKITEIDAEIEGLTKSLSLLTGTTVDPDNEFILPDTDTLQKTVIRPELEVFKSQMVALDLQKKVLRKENNPKLFLFGQGFYGRPGYDFLNTDMRVYGMTGAGLSWNINNVAVQKNKVKAIELNKMIVDKKKEAFNIRLENSLQQKEIEIQKYETIISKDQEIVNKRTEIMKAFSSQLDNGVITSSEYLTELNAENEAELNMALHKVQQAIAKSQYNILEGY